VIRSGRAALATLAFATGVGGGAFLALALRRLDAAVALAGVWALMMVVGYLLARAADPRQLKARAQANERPLDAWARGIGRLAGGWSPRQPSHTNDDPERPE